MIIIPVSFSPSFNCHIFFLFSRNFIVVLFCALASNVTLSLDGSLDPYTKGVGYQRFFRCNHSMYLNFKNDNTTLNPENVTVDVNFEDFAVQVFEFKDNKTGAFINGECSFKLA